MQEARRFLRYVIPGLLSILEAFLLIFLASPDQSSKILCVMKNLNAGGAFAAFLLTGALGYFLSAVHHTISWISCFQRFLVVDYRPFFHKAFGHKLVTKEDSDAQDVGNATKLSIEEASQTMAALWNESRESSKQVKAANDRVDSLTDQMHCAGASVVGTVLAFVIAFVACRSSDAHWWLLIVVFAVLFILHLCNYSNLQRHTRAVVEIVFWQELKRREKKPELLLWPKEQKF